MALPAEEGERQSFRHGYLRLLEPVGAGVPHNAQILAGKFLQRLALEPGVAGERERADDRLEVLLAEQGSVSEVKVVFFDAVLASPRLPVPTVLRSAKSSDPLTVLALAHIICNPCYTPGSNHHTTPHTPSLSADAQEIRAVNLCREERCRKGFPLQR